MKISKQTIRNAEKGIHKLEQQMFDAQFSEDKDYWEELKAEHEAATAQLAEWKK